MQCSEHKHGSLSHTTLGLTDHIHSQNSLRNALVLNLARMLETAVHDGAERLGLQDEVLETARVDADVVALLGVLGGGGGCCLLLL